MVLGSYNYRVIINEQATKNDNFFKVFNNYQGEHFLKKKFACVTNHLISVDSVQ